MYIKEKFQRAREHGPRMARIGCGIGLSLIAYYATALNTTGTEWEVMACFTAILTAKVFYPFSSAFCLLWVLLIGPVAQYAAIEPILLGAAGNDPVARLVIQNMLSLKGIALEFFPPVLATITYVVSARLVSLLRLRPNPT
jgi:hypothetical protein